MPGGRKAPSQISSGVPSEVEAQAAGRHGVLSHCTELPLCPISVNKLEAKFREEEQLERMYPTKLGVLKEELGDKVRVTAMAAIQKPDRSIRPLRDATHSCSHGQPLH